MATANDIKEPVRRGRPKKESADKVKIFSFCVPASEVEALKKLANEHNGLSNFVKYSIDLANKEKTKQSTFNPSKMSKQELATIVQSLKSVLANS